MNKEEINDMNELLKLTTIPLKYINIIKLSYNPSANNNNSNNSSTNKNLEYFNVISINNYSLKKDLPILVLLPDAASTSLSYFKLFKQLSNYFQIFSIDLPGQGLSSPIKYDFSNKEKCEEYFITRLKFIFDNLKIKNFILLSHSFSSYLSGLFYIKYPEYINYLIFISPLGLIDKSKELVKTKNINDVYLTNKSLGIIKKIKFNLFYPREKFKGLNDNEHDIYTNLLYNILLKENTSVNSLYSLFDDDLRCTYNSLSLFIDNFKDLKNKLLIIYGEYDWCNVINGEEFRNLIGENNVDIVIIDKSEHMSYTDNFQDLIDKMFIFFDRESIIHIDYD